MMVAVTVSDGLARIRFDNPPWNLLSDSAKAELTEAFLKVGRDPAARVVVFETAGPHFSAGADLREFPARVREHRAPMVWAQGHRLLASILACPQPTLVAASGRVLGGGAELFSAFDIRLLAESASVGYPEVSRGVFPGNGGLERLVQLVGPATALPLLLGGQLMGAETALRVGLATEVWPPSRLADQVARWTTILLGHPAFALTTIKQAVKMVDQAPESFPDQGALLFDSVHRTRDVMEAVTAFLEKRPPHFQHEGPTESESTREQP